MSTPRVVIQRNDGLYFKVTRPHFEWVADLQQATVFASPAATETCLRTGRLRKTDPSTLRLLGLKDEP